MNKVVFIGNGLWLDQGLWMFTVSRWRNCTGWESGHRRFRPYSLHWKRSKVATPTVTTSCIRTYFYCCFIAIHLAFQLSKSKTSTTDLMNTIPNISNTFLLIGSINSKSDSKCTHALLGLHLIGSVAKQEYKKQNWNLFHFGDHFKRVDRGI